MPSSNADVLKDVRELIAAIDVNAAVLPEAVTAKAELEQILTEMEDLSAQRNTLDADKQVLSARLLERRREAKQKSSELRAFLRFKLGQRNKKLTEFQVQPLLATLASPKRPRSKKAALKAKPVEITVTPVPESAA